MKEFILVTLSSLLTSTALLGAMGWLLKKWIGTRIDSSIKLEYDKLKAEYEYNLKNKERAQLVAELLAEWISNNPSEPMTKESRKKINKLSFEATLWLPESIAKDLSKILQHEHNTQNIFSTLLQVRSHLNGTHELTEKDVTYWGYHHEFPNRGLPDEFIPGQLNVEKLATIRNEEKQELILETENFWTSIDQDIQVLLTIKQIEVPVHGITSLMLVKRINEKSLTIKIQPKELAAEIERYITVKSHQKAEKSQIKTDKY